MHGLYRDWGPAFPRPVLCMSVRAGLKRPLSLSVFYPAPQRLDLAALAFAF
jgi:hypothetical protein